MYRARIQLWHKRHERSLALSMELMQEIAIREWIFHTERLNKQQSLQIILETPSNQLEMIDGREMYFRRALGT